DGNRDCIGTRQFLGTESWQLDTVDPYNHPNHPPQYFSPGVTTLIMSDWDAPGYNIHDYDATLVDMNFETYVVYFTSNPVNRVPSRPIAIYQRALPLQGNSQPYGRLRWAWDESNVVFN